MLESAKSFGGAFLKAPPAGERESAALSFAVERNEEEKRVNSIVNSMTQILKTMLPDGKDPKTVRPHWSTATVQVNYVPVGKLVNQGATDEKWKWFDRQIRRLIPGMDLELLAESSQI